MNSQKIITALFALLITSSMVVGMVGPAVAQEQPSAVDSMTPVGDITLNGQSVDNVNNADAYNVYATTGADTLSVAYSFEFARNANAAACDQPAVGSNPNCEVSDITLDLTDDVNHNGRQVAIRQDVVDAATGDAPSAAFIQHSSGDEYAVTVEEDGEYYVFTVERFSTNTVTFSGEVNINADPATDGSTFSYDITGENLSDIDVTLTGVLNQNQRIISGMTTGDDISVNTGGNVDPTGPNGQPQITVTNAGGTQTLYEGTADDSFVLTDSGGSQSYEGQVRIPDAPQYIDEVEMLTNQYTGCDGATTFDIRMHTEGPTTDTSVLGTRGETVASGVQCPSPDSTWTIPLDQPFENPDGGEVIVEIVANGSPDNIHKLQVETSSGTSAEPTQWRIATDGYVQSDNKHPAVWLSGPEGDSGTISGASDSVNWSSLSSGESQTLNMDITTSDDTLSASSSGAVYYEVSMTEQSETIDPVITANGQEIASYTGSLTEGATETYTVSPDVLTDGTNTIEVSTTSPSSGPESSVGVEYQHTASNVVSTDYTAEHWQERYNVSHTYTDAHENAKLTIPFTTTMHNVASVEVAINGGDWQSLDASDYSLDGTTATINLRNVGVGDKVDVKAVGHKVDARDGSIEVLQPTNVGEALNSQIHVTEAGENFRLGIGDTEFGDRALYLSSTNYEDSATTQFHESSAIELLMPNANPGSSATVHASSLGVDEVDSTMKVDVQSVGDEMVDFNVLSGSGTISFHDTTSGESYALKDADGNVVEVSQANSPVFFGIPSLGDYSVEWYEGSGNSGESTIGPIQQTTEALPGFVILGGALAIITLLYVVQRKFWAEDNDDRVLGVLPANPIWLVGTGLTLVVSVEILSGGALTASLAGGLTEIVPLLGILFGGLIAYWAFKKFIKGSDPKIVVRGGEK